MGRRDWFMALAGALLAFLAVALLAGCRPAPSDPAQMPRPTPGPTYQVPLEA